jgi:hypothetical protein
LFEFLADEGCFDEVDCGQVREDEFEEFGCGVDFGVGGGGFGRGEDEWA